MSVLAKDLADIAENRDNTVFGGGAIRVRKVAYLGKYRVEHGVEQAFLLGEVPVERRGVNTEFFAQGPDGQFGNVVGFDKVQSDANEVAFRQIGPMICHDHDNSEIAGGEIRSRIPKCHFEESFV